MRDTATARSSESQLILRGVGSVALVIAWLGLVYAQSITAFLNAYPASHCAIALQWDRAILNNPLIAVAGVILAAVSGYTFCRSRTGWGRGTLIASQALCSALTLLMALAALFLVLASVEDLVTSVDGPPPSLRAISLSLTTTPGLFAVSTLVVCWLMRRSLARPQLGAFVAGLVPIVWYMVTFGVRFVAVTLYCA